MKQWFREIPNDAFSAGFQTAIQKIIDLSPAADSHEYFLDALLADDVDLDRIAEITDPENWHHLTLMAACYLESPEDAEHTTTLLFGTDAFSYLTDELGEWPKDGGVVIAWESLQVKDIDLKNRLIRALYAHGRINYLEIPMWGGDDYAHELYLPLTLGRQVRLKAYGVIKPMARFDETRVPGYISEACSPEYLLSQSSSKHAKTIEFLRKLINDYSSTELGMGASYPYQALVEVWFYELVRNALIIGSDPERVIAGGKIVIAAFTDFILDKFPLPYEVGKDEAREIIARFERQALINALTPFPRAVALMQPGKEDFLPSAKRLQGPSLTLSGPFINGVYRGMPGCSASFMLRTMEDLQTPFELDDLDLPEIGRMVVLESYLALRNGISPEVEQWFNSHKDELHHQEFWRFGQAILPQVESLQDETLLNIHLYRAQAFVQDNSWLASFDRKIPYRKGQALVVIELLKKHSKLDLLGIKAMELTGEHLRPYMDKLSFDVRRHLLGDELGL